MTASQDRSPPPPAVRLTGIVKRFPGVVANRDINLEVASGTIHAVVGENGAGKSTLMKILYGMQRPDEGSIEIDGETVSFRSPTDAIARGVGMVHQHFMLAGQLTVTENIILGHEPRSRWPLSFHTDLDEARRRIRELGARYGLAVDPDALVEDLGVGERQRVEILKVLYRGATILILDEPTAVLVPQEVDELFENLRALEREGITIVFISHKLDEVRAIAEEITVVRAGVTVATRRSDEVTTRQLAELMVGSELPSPESHDDTVTPVVALRLEEVSAESDHGLEVLHDVSITVHAGEIVGIAGIEGNGQTQLIDAILGTQPLTAGTIGLGDQDVSEWSTRRRREAGLGLIPEDRHRHGLLLQAPLWENQMLGHQTQAPNMKAGGFIDHAGARARTEEIIAEFDVRTPGVDVSAESLSGGNQQKLIIGRELKASPMALVAAHPTRGVDVGAQAAIWDQLRRARRDGLAVLLISADLEELIGLSNTLLVMSGGRIVAELDPNDIDPRELGAHMTGAGVNT